MSQTQNLYFRKIIGRQNVIKNYILAFFMAVASYPRLLLEVFIRKDFGERYFNLMPVIIMTIVLAAVPLMPWDYLSMLSDEDSGRVSFWVHWLTWYVFLGALLWVSIRHHRALKHSPSVFDFARFSFYGGKIDPRFYNIKIGGKTPDIRTVETLLEPGLFFIAGIILVILQQRLGILITLCSVFYCLGYMAAYRSSDHFVMDKIDEMILNEDLYKAFVENLPEDETRGVRFVGRKPVDPEFRQRLMPYLIGSNTDDIEAGDFEAK